MIYTVAIVSAAVMVALAVIAMIAGDDYRDEGIWTLVTVSVTTLIASPIVTLMVAIINKSAGPAACAVTVTVLCCGGALFLIEGFVWDLVERVRYRRWEASR